MPETTETKTEIKATEKPSQLKYMIRRAAALAIIAAIVGGAVWYFFIRAPKVDPHIIKLSGRIEGDDAAVAAKVSGRLREINVREGDEVKAGQVIATIDDEQVRAREEQERSLVTQAEARVTSAQQQIAVLEAQLDQSNTGVEQAKIDAGGRVSQAEADVAHAEAQLVKEEANFKQARYENGMQSWLPTVTFPNALGIKRLPVRNHNQRLFRQRVSRLMLLGQHF